MAKTTFKAAGFTFEATPMRRRGKQVVMWRRRMRGQLWGERYLPERTTRADIIKAFGVTTP